MDYDPKHNERRWGIIMTVLACITALMCFVSCSKQETQRMIVIVQNDGMIDTQLDVTVNGKTHHFDNDCFDTIMVPNRAKVSYTFTAITTNLNYTKTSVRFDAQSSGTIHEAYCDGGQTISNEFKYKQ